MGIRFEKFQFNFSLIALTILLTILFFAAADNAAAKKGQIVHDGEYEFLLQQHGDKWAAEDKEIDAMLSDLRKANDGKPPNILYILIDDVSFGLMGNPELNYVTGIRTPNINQFADESLSLMRMYTEPSCTPTRAAFLTGRHPVRMGLKETKVALVGEGLPKKEVTIAEVLSKAGYNTSHVGKWHQGDIEESYPHNQGFDYAAYPAHQQVQLSLMTREAADSYALLGWHGSSQSDSFELDKKFRPYGLVTGLEAKKGGLAEEVDLKPGEEWTLEHYVNMNLRYQRQALEQLDVLAKQDKPFFLQYWPLWPLNFAQSDIEESKSLNGGYHAEKLQELDDMLGEIFAEMDKLGIVDNTVVVLMADNGLFLQYAGPSGFSDLIYRGGKAQHLEGGVRVDAFVRWPAAIEAGSMAGDIIHVSDLFTTLARIAQATGNIPSDRVIDGVDQTALLLKGEGHGRRDYVYIYENDVLRSVVKQEYKMHLPPPGVPGAIAPVFNLYRDPREEKPQTGTALWSGASFQDMVKRHQIKISEYPHFKLGKDRPYGGIKNLRPESQEIVETFVSWQPKK